MRCFESSVKNFVNQAKYEGTEFEPERRVLIARQEIDPNTYITLHKNITVGKYAVYYFGTEKSSRKPRIVKIFRPIFFSSSQRRAGVEKQILSQKDKPASMPALHFAFSYQFYKCLVLEPMYNESLEEKLLYARRLLPDVVQSFMVDIVCAVGFLHTHKIIHRNLTLDSFWIQADRHLKLTDYTHCSHKHRLANWSTLFRVRPTEFTAPELFSSSPYSKQSDIWALGVIFYRMSRGRFPFYGSDRRDLKKNIMTAEEPYSELFTISSRALCSEMLQKKPENRIGYQRETLDAFSDHFYFDNVDWKVAHNQSEAGPPVQWEFAVAQDERQLVGGEVVTKKFEDLDSIDVKKLKVKPLRLDALRDGSYKFSPEYLEQEFPGEASKQSNKARRLSLHMHMIQAFLDLENGIENEEDVESALKEYYSFIGKEIAKFSAEKKTHSIGIAGLFRK
ncbi:hypothetical protein RRG08_054245 [Elysia crispata]|uniref:Protein kinase domain-containing protein n=1 Tax=Elysia crispata TaxID=231223 RepID=A0AAE0YBU1_9GAST|nr:hypothetical protein RRG08_054245 [Elysia crispata]